MIPNSKKRLGQHFLTSRSIAKRIADTADISYNDIILEIGPGKGMLTDALLEKNPKKIIAVEKDSTLVQFLKTKYAHEKRIEIIEGDILKVLPTLRYSLLATHYKLVSNIPYYLTSYLIRSLLENGLPKPISITFMVQEEVAERITARPPRMNLLATSVQAYATPHIAFRVPKKYFSPQPKIDSAVIVIEHISEKFFKELENPVRNKISSGTREKFFALLHYGFGSKRKMLIGNLSKYMRFAHIADYRRLDADLRRNSKIPMRIESKKQLEKIFTRCKIDAKARAENLSLKEWKCLFLRTYER